MLIQSYGEFWNPFLVQWSGSSLKGSGEIDGTTCEIEFWAARGIYVLLHDFKPVYVGKADGTSIGDRLKSHLTDRLAGRWDMFSWYSICKPNKTYGNVNDPTTRTVDLSDAISTFEALGILITDPPLNRKRESIPAAIEFEQVQGANPKTIREYLEAILAKMQ